MPIIKQPLHVEPVGRHFTDDPKGKKPKMLGLPPSYSLIMLGYQQGSTFPHHQQLSIGSMYGIY